MRLNICRYFSWIFVFSEIFLDFLDLALYGLVIFLYDALSLDAFANFGAIDKWTSSSSLTFFWRAVFFSTLPSVVCDFFESVVFFWLLLTLLLAIFERILFTFFYALNT